MRRTHPVPSVPGVLSSAQVAETAASIASMQEDDGAVPWTVGEHVDVWNHVEAAMAMVDVIRTDELSRLRHCAADDCSGVLVDLSRNRSRRFCSTACSNRVNVAAFRARQS